MYSYKNLAVLALAASAISQALAAPAQAGRNHARGLPETSSPPPYEHATLTIAPVAGRGMDNLARAATGSPVVVDPYPKYGVPPLPPAPSQSQPSGPSIPPPRPSPPPPNNTNSQRSTLGRRTPEEFRLEPRADESESSDGVDFNNLHETPLSHDHRRDQQSDLLGTVAVLNALSKSNPGKRADDIDPASVALLHALISRWSKRGDDVDGSRESGSGRAPRSP